jgi:hypothetical protein
MLRAGADFFSGGATSSSQQTSTSQIQTQPPVDRILNDGKQLLLVRFLQLLFFHY